MEKRQYGWVLSSDQPEHKDLDLTWFRRSSDHFSLIEFCADGTKIWQEGVEQAFWELEFTERNTDSEYLSWRDGDSFEKFESGDVTGDVGKARQKARQGEAIGMYESWPVVEIPGSARNIKVTEGDVVLLRSGWDDRYVEGAENRRYAYNVFVQGSEPGWPAPSESAMQLLVDRGVKLVGTDGPTMGPAQGGRDVHLIGLGAGTCFIECMANLSELPETGAFFVFLPLKIVNGTGAPGRAIAFIP